MIKIKGHSNFEVKIINNKNKLFISKSSDNSNKEILKKQMDKQDNIYQNNFLFPVKIPKIISFSENEYIMEYIDDSINIVDFLIKNNFIKVNWFIKNIIFIVDKYIQKCNLQKINENVLVNKINDVKQKININLNNIIEKSFNYLYSNLKNISTYYIPVGYCHGDLTFSNILIDTNNNDLYLIDFLNSFIESPLLDIIKIRQDTKYYWTTNLCNFSFDYNKVIIMLNYIDKHIDSHFEKYDFYKGTYKYFQILNFLRILQYCNNPKIEKYIINILDELIS